MAKRKKYVVIYMNDTSAEPLDSFFISTCRNVKDIVTSESFDYDKTDIHGVRITKQYLKFIESCGICDLEANESVTFHEIPEDSDFKAI